MKKILIFTLTLFVFACSKKDDQPKVTINTQDKEIVYNVEVATTPEELAKGLMNRDSLAQDAGMIFNLPALENTVMWMKNTKISLDMLFVSPEGKIVCIKENATPMSEEYIICDKEVDKVLEINAGQVAKNGIKLGDSLK